jgi:hypothetical protein
MTSFALPRTAVAAHLQLTHGVARNGEIFVFERVPEHSGVETPLEMLNRPEGFFPFRPDGKGAVLLVTKALTVLLTVSHQAMISDPDRLSAAKTIPLEVMLANGRTLKGVAAFEAPEHHARLLDYLNASREPFFAVSTGDATHYVNRSHVLYARPQE